MVSNYCAGPVLKKQPKLLLLRPLLPRTGKLPDEIGASDASPLLQLRVDGRPLQLLLPPLLMEPNYRPMTCTKELASSELAVAAATAADAVAAEMIQ